MTIENGNQRSTFSTKLSQEKLKRYLHYNPETGKFTWIRPTNSTVKVGDTAGHIDESKMYVIISLLGRHYYAHVLAWFYVYGEWRRIDHKNRLGIDNELRNLRPATQKQNNQNASVRIDNLLGVKGVSRSGRKFVARVHSNGVTLHLGTFETLEEAKDARKKKAIELFGEFANE